MALGPEGLDPRIIEGQLQVDKGIYNQTRKYFPWYADAIQFPHNESNNSVEAWATEPREGHTYIHFSLQSAVRRKNSFFSNELLSLYRVKVGPYLFRLLDAQVFKCHQDERDAYNQALTVPDKILYPAQVRIQVPGKPKNS